MTVYVDDMRLPAQVGRHDDRWSHLMADSSAELIEFARRLGLQAAWLQRAGQPSEHFDLTDAKRDLALRLGAVPISYPHDTAALVHTKRQPADHVTEPDATPDLGAAFRVLVTGSRAWTNHAAITTTLASLANEQPHLVVVHGACPRGADLIADRWATTHHVAVERHPADWNTHGYRGGIERNLHMISLGANVCLAFIRNHSRGATHCANAAARAGIPVRRWFA